MLVVTREKLGKVHRVRALDIGYEQTSRPVLFLNIDRDAEIYILVLKPGRNAVYNTEAKIKVWISFNGLNNRPGNYMRKRNLASPLRRQVLVDNAAILFQHLDRNIAKTRRRRNSQALFHVFDDLFAHAGYGFWLGIGRQWNGNGLFCRSRFHGCDRRRWCGGRNVGRRPSVQQIAEIRLPRFVNQLRIRLVSLQQSLDISRVRPKSFLNIRGQIRCFFAHFILYRLD